MLVKRRSKRDETVQEYYYVMKEIATGHTAKLCNASDDSEAVADKKTEVINTVTDAPSDRMFKRITINGVRVNALIDTGSQITVMRKDVYDSMKLDKLRGNSICLTGFGKNEVHSLDCVNIIIEVDRLPRELKDIQSFLGLTGYFRKFISSYFTIVKPLSDMLWKDQSYNFDDKARNAFIQLKTILTQNPVLKIYHLRHETEVHTDASIDDYGAVLLQRSDEDNLLHPVYFMSKKTKKEERNYTNLLVIPRTLELDVIRTIHEKGHMAAKCTEERIRQEYFIRDLRSKVERHIASCVQCILTDRKDGRQEGYLHPIPKPDVPLHTYLNKAIISILSKLSIEVPAKWYRHIDKLQRILNSMFNRSVNATPFDLLFGVKMRVETDLKLREVIAQEFRSRFEEERKKIRVRTKEQILKVQSENCKTYNLRRKKAIEYQVGDVVAIKRTQLGSGRKLRAKYLGPYLIKKVKLNDTYNVIKSGVYEGPVSTFTCAEYVKSWNTAN
ncbi:POL3 protein, partial [Pseudoatta argentina]